MYWNCHSQTGAPAFSGYLLRRGLRRSVGNTTPVLASIAAAGMLERRADFKRVVSPPQAGRDLTRAPVLQASTAKQCDLFC